MSSIARILDANANRAREALRVMEDVARFALDDASLSGACKVLRHDLAGALDTLPPGWLDANRDTPGDVGTDLDTQAEMQRSGLLDMVTAAGRRLGESLRTIEETAKTIDATLARRVETLRYHGYTIEQRLLARLGSGRARPWRLCLVLTEAACRRPWQEVLAAALEGGADCVQVREKTMTDAGLRERLATVIEIARPAGASVIVNDRADLALAAGADGVHLGRDDLSIRDVRRLAGRALIIGATVHDLDEAQAAIEAGADYCGVGAMFASPVKPERRPAGPALLRAFIERHPAIPHLAIGGITPANVHTLVEAGCRGKAVCSAICAAEDPAAVTRDLLAAATAHV